MAWARLARRLALRPGADATGGDAGDATVFKADAGVDDVLMTAKGHRAQGVDIVDGGADQRQNQVEVMDHEIQHATDVGRTPGEGTVAFAFDQLGIDRPAGQFLEGGIEALHMPDLESDA